LEAVADPADYPLPDLAVLAVEGAGDWAHPCAALAAGPPVLGGSPDPLYLAGCTIEHGPRPAPTRAATEVEAPGTEDGQLFSKLKKGQVVGGFSGSPLLNMRTLGVAGIVESSRGRHADLGGFAVPAAEFATAFPDAAEANQRFHGTDARWADARRQER